MDSAHAATSVARHSMSSRGRGASRASAEEARGRGGLLAPERAVVRHGLEGLEDAVEKASAVGSSRRGIWLERNSPRLEARPP